MDELGQWSSIAATTTGPPHDVHPWARNLRKLRRMKHEDEEKGRKKRNCFPLSSQNTPTVNDLSVS